jgi:hypothetical protein
MKYSVIFGIYQLVLFNPHNDGLEVFTAVTMANAIFWDVACRVVFVKDLSMECVASIFRVKEI